MSSVVPRGARLSKPVKLDGTKRKVKVTKEHTSYHKRYMAELRDMINGTDYLVGMADESSAQVYFSQTGRHKIMKLEECDAPSDDEFKFRNPMSQRIPSYLNKGQKKDHRFDIEQGDDFESTSSDEGLPSDLDEEEEELQVTGKLIVVRPEDVEHLEPVEDGQEVDSESDSGQDIIERGSGVAVTGESEEQAGLQVGQNSQEAAEGSTESQAKSTELSQSQSEQGSTNASLEKSGEASQSQTEQGLTSGSPAKSGESAQSQTGKGSASSSPAKSGEPSQSQTGKGSASSSPAKSGESAQSQTGKGSASGSPAKDADAKKGKSSASASPNRTGAGTDKSSSPTSASKTGSAAGSPAKSGEGSDSTKAGKSLASQESDDKVHFTEAPAVVRGDSGEFRKPTGRMTSVSMETGLQIKKFSFVNARRNMLSPRTKWDLLDDSDDDCGDIRPSNCGMGPAGSAELVLEVSVHDLNAPNLESVDQSCYDQLRVRGFNWILVTDILPETNMELVAKKVRSAGLRLMIDYTKPEFVEHVDGLRCTAAELRLRDDYPKLVMVGKVEGDGFDYIYDSAPTSIFRQGSFQQFIDMLQWQDLEQLRHFVHYSESDGLEFWDRAAFTATAAMLLLPGMRVVRRRHLDMCEAIINVVHKKAVRRGVMTVIQAANRTGHMAVWKYTRGRQHILICANFAKCHCVADIKCEDAPESEDADGKIPMLELISDTTYMRDVQELHTTGLTVILYEYQIQVFEY